jgi:hypothetical protein
VIGRFASLEKAPGEVKVAFNLCRGKRAIGSEVPQVAKIAMKSEEDKSCPTMPSILHV